VKAQERTVLEQRRIRAAKATALLAFVFLAVLALWQCIEASCSRELGDSSRADPLAIEQVGIAFMDANDESSIIWYQSFWDVSQSRILLERSLVLQGWQSLSTVDEPVMSFVYISGGSSRGSSLLASFYSLEEGCSILIELL